MKKLAILFTRSTAFPRDAVIDGELACIFVGVPVTIDPASLACTFRDWGTGDRAHRQPWQLTQSLFSEQLELYRTLGFDIRSCPNVPGDFFVILPLDAPEA